MNKIKSIYLLLIAILAVSCTSLEGKFTKTQSANMGAFADQTIAMLAESNVTKANDKSIYTRKYIDFTDKDVQAYEKLLEDSEAFFDKIIEYSIALATIVETNKSVPEQIEAYSKYLEKLQESAEGKTDMTPELFDQIISDVRSQDDFLDALQVAQPIMNAAGRYGMLLMNKIDKSAKLLMRDLDRKIDEDYAEVIAFQEALETEKYVVLNAIAMLYSTYKGDMNEFERFRQSDAVLDKTLIPQGEPSVEELTILSDHLEDRLKTIHTIWSEVEPDWVVYRATHEELDEQYNALLGETRRARMFLLIWFRAHQKMSAGISNPAEWFAIEDAPALLYKTLL
jgi:hypothetical protein